MTNSLKKSVHCSFFCVPRVQIKYICGFFFFLRGYACIHVHVVLNLREKS